MLTHEPRLVVLADNEMHDGVSEDGSEHAHRHEEESVVYLLGIMSENQIGADHRAAREAGGRRREE